MNIKFNFRDIDKISFEIINILKENNIFFVFLKGDLGSGKTTLVKSILKNFEIQNNIVSPTFNYLNIYKNDLGVSFYHFDLYRIVNFDNFLKMGFFDYLFLEKSYFFVEWPEILEKNIKMSYLNIKFDYLSIKKRNLILDIYKIF